MQSRIKRLMTSASILAGFAAGISAVRVSPELDLDRPPLMASQRALNLLAMTIAGGYVLCEWHS